METKLISIYDEEKGWINKRAEILIEFFNGFMYPALVKLKNGYAVFDAKKGLRISGISDKDLVLSQVNKGAVNVTEEKFNIAVADFAEKNPLFAERPLKAKEYLTDQEIAQRERLAETEKEERGQISKFATLVRRNIVDGGIRASELQLEHLKANENTQIADGFTYPQAVAGYKKAIQEYYDARK